MAKNVNGWITLHRKILNWEWYDDTNTFRLFLHLLLTANYEDADFRGMKVRRGQLIFGRQTTSKKLGLSEREIRTSLDRLKTSGETSTQTTNRFSIITICNYEKYQRETTSQTSTETTGERHAKRPQYNKYNNNKQNNNAVLKKFKNFKDLPNPFDE